jgi:hypothetical protein
MFRLEMFEALVAFVSLACSVCCPGHGGRFCRLQEEGCGCLTSRVRELRAGKERKRKIMKDECAPRVLMNCPSFRAALYIWESLDTRQVMFVSVMMTDCVVSALDVVERRKISEAAP